MKVNVSLGLLLGLVVGAASLGQNATISFTSGGLELAGGGSSPQIVLDGKDWPGVIRTAHDLAADFGRATGHNGTVVLHNGTANGPSSTGTIIAGTIGNSSLINSMIKSGKIDVSKINGKWESYSSQLVSDPMPGVSSALVIAGSDKRGAIYGLYDVSEQIGVSPWYYYADVPAKHNPMIYAMEIAKTQGPPSVKYRGIFLNDEQPSLTNWVNDNFQPGKYGPGFNRFMYAPIFELLLRLKANYIWPAEWNSMFAVDDPLAPPEADMYGIVLGTSHTEPMMRWTKEQSLFLNGTWSWTTNQENMTEFMRQGAERAWPYENMWTMGMRGLGDTASPTLNSSQLQQIIGVQQTLLRDTFHRSNISTIPQMWCLYKEVGTYFAEGMDVPEDITLLWADDNFGNVQRLPLSNETSRSGGGGVYFHFDYVGNPRNYKWINTIQLQRTWEQMHLAYQRQARQIWIVNVGDLKPLELPINHFFDMAYDMPSMMSPDSTSSWLQMWATREFGSAVADATAKAMSTYGMLAGRRKYELLDPTVYSVQNYNETGYVLQQWQDLANSAQGIYNKLDKATRPSFFEIVLHPILAGMNLHQIHFAAAMQNAYAYEWRQSANALAQEAQLYFATDKALQNRYHSLLDGKWKHMMDQTHIGQDWWQQSERDVLPPLLYVQSQQVALAGLLGVTAEAHNGSAPGDSVYNIANSNATQITPPLDPYGPKSRYIDVYLTGPGSARYTVTPTVSWVVADPASGTLSSSGGSTDQRVTLTVDWSRAPDGSSLIPINVTSSAGYGSYAMPLAVLPVNNTAVPPGFRGFVESDGHVSIEAEHASSNTSTDDARYAVIPGYGRTLSGVTLLPVTASSQTTAAGPRLSYDFYAFTGADNANVAVYVGTGLNTIPARPLRYAVAIDRGQPVVVQPVPTTILGTLPAAWTAAVSNAAYANSTMLPVTPGRHTLDLWALEPGLVFQKIVVDLGGVRPSYLGPPESMRV